MKHKTDPQEMRKMKHNVHAQLMSDLRKHLVLYIS